jgi:oxygen-independent coproporphyrinogen-3 oxidase
MKGIYIHIPFCAKKCPYCDFYSAVGVDFLKEKYIAALRAELEVFSNLYDLSAVKTLYFGGGTPSSLPPSLYESFFKYLSEFISLENLEEITIEVNPESYSLEDFKTLRGLGFNRISLGVQSFDDETLKVLGRTHDAKTSLVALENIHRAGFENISVDLIWGVPEQTPERLRGEFEVLKNTPAVHLSAYKLTLYEDTPLYRLARRGRFKLPTEGEIEKLYYTLLEEAERLGFERYEISNFAKGRRYFSKHNLLYWRLEPFLGLGASAWSFDGKRRWANPRPVERYLEKLKNPARSAGVDFIAEEIVELDERELLKERIIMGLRTTEGVERGLVEDKLPKEYLEEFFTLRGDRIAFNDRGFLVSNYLLSEILSGL